MPTVKADSLPDNALLRRYQITADDPGAQTHTDCFSVSVTGSVTLAEYVVAFYTTPLFRLERIILKYLARRPSSDAEAARMVDGSSDSFAAWEVEGRCTDQLLMCDFRGRTRSWFMVAAERPADEATTRLYFGSAIVPVRDRTSGRLEMGKGYSMLLSFHKYYSIALLKAAKVRLEKLIAR